MRSEAIKNRFSFEKIFTFLGISQKTSVDFSLILFANIVNNGTNFIANILIARMYGHEVFGLFSIAMNIAMTTLIFSEFGMNLTMVRLYKLNEQDPVKSNAVLIWNFYFKLMVLTVIILAGAIFGSNISHALTQRADYTFLVAIALICGGLLGLFSYLKAFFQSFNSFKYIAYIILAYAFLRLVFLFFYIVFSIPASPEVLFAGLFFVPVLLILIVCFYTEKGKLKFDGISFKTLKETGKDIINYSKWVAISGISFVMIQKSLFFIVAYYGDIKQVSLLSAGLVFTAVFSMINDSVRQILFPKISQLDINKIKEYKNRILKIFPFYILFSLFLIGILSVLMYFVLGEQYSESLPIFWICGGGVAITAGIGFYTITIHTIQKPQIDAYINIGRFFVLIIFLFLIKTMGIIPMALAYAGIIIIGELLMAVYVSNYIKSHAKHI